MRVTLPLAPVTSSAPAVAVAVAAPRRGRVLVIDDEPRITRILARALGARHEVVAVNHAGDALTRLDAGERFDVILCDLMMPDITGSEVHAHLARTQPARLGDLVFLTGGAFTPEASAFLAGIANEHITKPFALATVTQLVDRYVARAR